ncbi:hypothetical protein DSECCO2_510480 [anaerobic digester metagenome]
MCVIQFGKSILRLLADAADAVLQQVGPARCGFAVAADGLAVDVNHTVVAQGLHIDGSQLAPTVEHALVAPVIAHIFLIDLLGLFTHKEGIVLAGAHRIKLGVQNRGRAICAQDTAARLETGAANE